MKLEIRINQLLDDKSIIKDDINNLHILYNIYHLAKRQIKEDDKLRFSLQLYMGANCQVYSNKFARYWSYLNLKRSNT